MYLELIRPHLAGDKIAVTTDVTGITHYDVTRDGQTVRVSFHNIEAHEDPNTVVYLVVRDANYQFDNQLGTRAEDSDE